MRLFPVSLVLLLAWGALAIGGSPSWAAASVAVLCVSTGILGLIESRRRTSAERLGKSRYSSVGLALCLFFAAIAAQLIPLPASLVSWLSPARSAANFERLLAAADRREVGLVPDIAADARRPLSIAPERTWWGLGLLAGIGCLLVGATRGMSIVDLPAVTRAIVFLGVVVALLGFRELADDSVLIYGIYRPLWLNHLSASFINHNHQAGWMVMVLSMSVGAFIGETTRGLRGLAPGLRQRILWLSTKQANVALLILFASIVMAIGVIVTQSRSGAASLVAALTILALWSARRHGSTLGGRAVMAGVIAVIVIGSVTQGSDVANRIAGTSWITMDGRVGLWENSLRVAREFWLTGTGFNTYGAAMLHYQTYDDGNRYIEAHNDYLQLAVEGGLLVVIPAVVLALSLVIEIRSRFREGADDTRTYWIRAGAVAGMVAIAIQSTVDFTLQMPGAAVMFVTLLAVALHRRSAVPDKLEFGV